MHVGQIQLSLVNSKFVLGKFNCRLMTAEFYLRFGRFNCRSVANSIDGSYILMSVWRIQLPVGHIQLQKGVDTDCLSIPNRFSTVF